MPNSIIITGGAWHHEIFGGAYKAATEFAEYLADKGHKVFYIAGSDLISITNPTIYRGVEVWRYPFPKAKSPSIRNLYQHIAQSRQLAKKIQEYANVEYLNGHDFLQFLGAMAGLKGRSIRASFSVHSPLVLENKARWGLSFDGQSSSEGPRPTLRQSLALSILRGIEKRVYRSAEIIQTDSNYTLKEISLSYPHAVNGKGVALPLWVDLKRFTPCEDKRNVRKELGGVWDCRVPLFFSVRRLVPRMGLDSLIRAISLLKRDGYDCRLIIGGTGPERELLDVLVKDLELGNRVFLIGKIPEEMLPLCFQAPDCFVLPTRALECFGLIILEAFACGTPVIATPIGSIPELLGNGNKNFLTKDITPEAIAEKMIAFLEKKMAVDASALRLYAEEYSLENKAEALCNAFFPDAGKGVLNDKIR